ncbi:MULTISPECIES: ATP synthase subunit I [Paraburkholderia]|uniref:ATP synthase subunit I n=1 Tax=Paraburkholderia TaxID=1822464 RepID=UPI00225153A8|nr:MULTISPECIES: ATP synthase subunit I [Paraburkholderia]MCX4157648.1 ATP synthase subunit I [Paraburkholderia aspalathi]MDN7167052.1 ATP synthase subunit I [Paraburkholderia sp. SECH2]MDQ6395538.1 ATP synthase subunit I [Paraburkholderia aspalathi]
MNSPLASIAAQLALGLSVGILAGAWHFLSLRWNWPLFASGKAMPALALQLARFALTGALFLMLADVGAIGLLAGMMGFLLARGVAVRRYGGSR